MMEYFQALSLGATAASKLKLDEVDLVCVQGVEKEHLNDVE
jgi:hypothetical protein